LQLAKNFWLEETVSRFLSLVTSILLVLSCLSAAQDHSTVDLFAGYQYTHVALGHNINGFNLNGWNVSATAFFTKYVGVSGDFSGNYGSPRISALSTSVSAQSYTYLFGPIVRVPNSSKITPYFHALFGGAHINANGFGLSGSDNAFSWALGGGVDAEVHPHIAIRLAQADWLRTQFADSTQSNFRYSVGLVFKY
jgi:opacity protein-like surface antigen